MLSRNINRTIMINKFWLICPFSSVICVHLLNVMFEFLIKLIFTRNFYLQEPQMHSDELTCFRFVLCTSGFYSFQKGIYQTICYK